LRSPYLECISHHLSGYRAQHPPTSPKVPKSQDVVTSFVSLYVDGL
jgi:hypothetical protein